MSKARINWKSVNEVFCTRYNEDFWSDYHKTSTSIYYDNFYKFKKDLKRDHPQQLEKALKKSYELVNQLMSEVIDRCVRIRSNKTKIKFDKIYRIYVTECSDTKSLEDSFRVDDFYISSFLEKINDEFIKNIGIGLLEKCNDNFYMFEDLDSAYKQIFDWILNVTANGKESHYQDKHTLREIIINDFNLKSFSTWGVNKGIIINIKLNFAPKGSLGYFESEKEGGLSLVKSSDKDSLKLVDKRKKELEALKIRGGAIYILFLMCVAFFPYLPILLVGALFLIFLMSMNEKEISKIEKQINEEYIQT